MKGLNPLSFGASVLAMNEITTVHFAVLIP